jgi:hypothetical protein
MKKSRLIDMFGLSGDPVNNDRLDALLFRLESNYSISCGGNAESSSLPFSVTICTSGFQSEDILFELQEQ